LFCNDIEKVRSLYGFDEKKEPASNGFATNRSVRDISGLYARYERNGSYVHDCPEC
jgi:hypothetical protein